MEDGVVGMVGAFVARGVAELLISYIKCTLNEFRRSGMIGFEVVRVHQSGTIRHSNLV